MGAGRSGKRGEERVNLVEIVESVESLFGEEEEQARWEGEEERQG